MKKEIRRAARGDETAAAALFDHYFPRIYRYAAAKLENETEAEDAAAESFAAAIGDLGRYRRRARGFEPWMFRIAGRRVEEYRGDDTEERFRPEGPSEVEREVLLLRFAAGVQSSDVARIRGAKRRDVRRLQLRALEELEGAGRPEPALGDAARAKALDRTLRRDEASGDEDIDSLLEIARDLIEGFDIDLPDARRERALFIEGVKARRGGLAAAVAGIAVPAALIVALVGFLLYASLAGEPGQPLYGVKRALAGAGLAPSAEDDIDDRIRAAGRRLDAAQESLISQPEDAGRLALDAAFHLGAARRLLPELDAEERSRRLATIEQLEETVARIFAEVDAWRRAPATPLGGPSEGAAGKRDGVA